MVVCGNYETKREEEDTFSGHMQLLDEDEILVKAPCYPPAGQGHLWIEKIPEALEHVQR